MLDDILLQVNKPGRYIGQEWNLPKRDFGKSKIKFALCFPDLYEVGMSNLGLRIIYGVLNKIEDVSCERFFSVDSDMEAILRNENKEIFSLETKRNLRDFDIIGFSLGYELNYTNVLNILDLGRIPLKASLRDYTYPLVMGGGPNVLNPEPMHEFFDLFVLGEGEEVILEIIDIYQKFKDKFKSDKINKEDLLIMFSHIEGVYVPSLYEPNYNPEGKLQGFRPRFQGVPTKIKKRFVKNLDNAYFPLDWLMPYIQIVHDRITLEIMRGCPHKCRFCQGKPQYFPFRQRNLQNILSLACAAFKQTGYEEISLGGLSVSDYSNIEELLKSLIEVFKEKAVSISLPSIKPKMRVGNMSSLIATIKKTGLTFAPEAGTQRLRQILAKDFDKQDFFKVLEQAYLAGYQHIKLYFMIGLPSEEKEDLDGIIDFAFQVSELRKKIDKSPARINLSINTLIPKPHTPFQWLGLEDLETIKYKQNYLKKQITRFKRLHLSLYEPRMSILEGILSRGDRRLAQVIYYAFKMGARFDAWGNHFKFDKWQEAFNKFQIEPIFYLKEKSTDEILPWDFLDVGISKELLLAEFKQISEATTYGTKCPPQSLGGSA